MQLINDDALGTINDVFAAAHQYGDLAEVDIFLGDLRHVLADQADTDAERQTVGQPQLPAFVGRVPRFVQPVMHILQMHVPVVRFDREDLTQQRLEPSVWVSCVVCQGLLEEPLVSGLLNIDQVGDR